MQANINDGGSLVELVVIITLIGMLSAFAVPRFTHLENAVRASQVVALSTNLRNVTATAHAQYVISGEKLNAATLNGKMIQLKNGYPDAGLNGIRAALANLSDFAVNFTSTSVTYSKIGAPFGAHCAVTYRAAPTTSAAAVITDLTTSGC